MSAEKASKKASLNREPVSNCEQCNNYEYDEASATYMCAADLDEDEMYSFITGKSVSCPYYVFYDEYKLGRPKGLPTGNE